MNAAPHPPANSRLRIAALGRHGFLTAVGVALWLVLLEMPNPPAPYLDASWQLALVHAHEQHHVFGRDVIFSAGPLGFLSSLYVLPGTLELKLWWEIIGKAGLALLILATTASLRPWRRVVFIVAVLLGVRLFPDTPVTLALGLIVLRWLLPREATRTQLALAVAVLALLAQLKFTLFLLAGAAVALRAATDFGRREIRPAFAIAGGFAATFLGLWLIAGQPFGALPAYVRSSLDFSSGYAWAMNFDEPNSVFLAGVATLALTLACCGQIARDASVSASERWVARAPAPFLAVFWFLNWKHGFIRGDGHTSGFFVIVLLLGLALPGLLAPLRRPWWFDVTAPLCVLGIWLTDAATFALIPGMLRDRIVTSAQHVTHLRELRADYAAGIERYRAGFDLPSLRAAVGHATVDLLNFEQGLLLINGLNYHPRPVFQSYAAYTPALMLTNAAFFAQPDAPEFVVVRFNTIDHRFPTHDDARVLAELPLRYEAALIEADFVLWKKKPATAHRPAGLTRDVIVEQGIALGAELILPTDRSHALWLQLDAAPSLIGKLRAAAYKAAELKLVVTDEDGNEQRYRVVPPMARGGFIVQPYLETFQDYALFAKGRGRQWLRSIRFEPAAPDQAELWSTLTVRISKLPDLPVEAVGASAQPAVRFSNVAPLEIRSDLAPTYFRVEGETAALVHAAGMVVFAPPAGTRRLRGGFGLAEGAYTGEGNTDGAQFSVEVVHASGATEVLWLRILEPKTKPADRGVQRCDVALPADAVRVVLRTTQGPSGKGDWDWTYWTQLEFSP